jgi:hypothetical protein
MDQWEFVPTLQKYYNHTLTVADVWAQHNEHRILFPRMGMLALAGASGWNIYLELAANYILAALIFLFLWLMLKRTFSGHPPAWLLILFSLVMFSPIESENWLWGWQIQFFMTVLGTVVAAWSLQRWPGTRKGLVLAIIAAVFAAYSLSGGLFTWVAILPILLLSRVWKLSHIAIWCGAAICTIGLYQFHYVKPPDHSSLTLFLSTPMEFISYVFAYLGGPLAFGELDVAIGVGILISAFTALMVGLVMRRRDELETLLPWLALGLQAIIVACATGIGRVGFGAEQALSSRYTTIASLLLLTAMVAFARWTVISRPKEARRAKKRSPKPSEPRFPLPAAALLVIFLIASGKSFATGVRDMDIRSRVLTQARLQLMAFPNTSEGALLTLHPRTDVVRERAQILRDLGLILPPAPSAPHPAAAH